MANVKELLLEQWEEEKEKLVDIDPEKMKEQHRLQVERINAIEKQLTDIERTEIEVEEKASSRDMDLELELKKIEVENNSIKTRNKIEVFKVGAPIVAAIFMGFVTMKWEKVDTLTSTAGKASLRDLLRFKI